MLRTLHSFRYYGSKVDCQYWIWWKLHMIYTYDGVEYSTQADWPTVRIYVSYVNIFTYNCCWPRKCFLPVLHVWNIWLMNSFRYFMHIVINAFKHKTILCRHWGFFEKHKRNLILLIACISYKDKRQDKAVLLKLRRDHADMHTN